MNLTWSSARLQAVEVVVAYLDAWRRREKWCKNDNNNLFSSELLSSSFKISTSNWYILSSLSLSNSFRTNHSLAFFVYSSLSSRKSAKNRRMASSSHLPLAASFAWFGCISKAVILLVVHNESRMPPCYLLPSARRSCLTEEMTLFNLQADYAGLFCWLMHQPLSMLPHLHCFAE